MTGQRRFARALKSILWLAAALVVGRFVWHAERYRTINALEHLGGHVRLNADDQPVGVDLHEVELSDAQLKSIGDYRLLTSFALTNCRIPPEGLRSIYRLPELRVLELHFMDCPPGGLRGIDDAQRLRSLSLLHCSWVNDAELAHLLALQQLEELTLSHTSITDAGLERLSALPNLEELSIDGCDSITDAGLLSLSRFPALRRVRAAEMNVAPETFAEVRNANPTLHIRGSSRPAGHASISPPSG